VEHSTVHEQTEGVNACDADITQLLTALEAKLHLWKAHNYQWRGAGFQNDCFFELKQALLCNPGNACAPLLQKVNFIQIFVWLT
jgi:hypothetical protein